MVYSALLITGLALSAFGQQQFVSAPVITDNVDAPYTATLFDSTSSTICGTVTANSGADGVGLDFEVSFTGLPPDAGPFLYHVHISPVPANGDCNATGGHLDPYNRGEQPPCDPSDPATCQIGDLSGKHGNATAPTFSAQYTDEYLSNNDQSNAFVGDKSIVIHASNGTRLNCGNFQLSSEIETEAKAEVPSKTTGATGTGFHVAFTSASTHRVSTSTSARAVPTSVPNKFTSSHTTTSARVVPPSTITKSTSTHTATTLPSPRVVSPSPRVGSSSTSTRAVPTSVPTKSTSTHTTTASTSTRARTTASAIDPIAPAAN